MSVRPRNIDSRFRLVGFFADETAYLAYIKLMENRAAFKVGDIYYDIALGTIRFHNGSGFTAVNAVEGAGYENLIAYDAQASEITFLEDVHVIDKSLEVDVDVVVGGDLAVTGDVVFSGNFQVTGEFDPGSILLKTGEELNLGTGSEFDLSYVSSITGLALDAAAANSLFQIGNTATVDVLFKGAAKDVQFDASRNQVLAHDDAIIGFGGSKDSEADYSISTAGSGADLIIAAKTANTTVAVGDGTTATDFKIKNITTADADIYFQHAADGGDGTLFVGKNDKGIDVIFYGETAGAKAQWDMSIDSLVLTNANLQTRAAAGVNGHGLTVPFKASAGVPGTTGTPDGAIVFNTNDSKIYVFDGTNWVATAALI